MSGARGPGRPGKVTAHNKQPSMEVYVDQHYSTKVYTSGSKITGHVAINTLKDTPFDTLNIVFVGIAATRLDFVSTSSGSASRTFMKLHMPIPESDLPDQHILKAAHAYKIPFHFVVPHELTLGACTHHCSSEVVRDQHLRLPPSVGGWFSNDQSPEMTQIDYTVKARVTGMPERGSEKVVLMDAKKMVKVLPAFPEDAPLNITFRDERYNLSKEKPIKKNLFSAKTGKLEAICPQPGAIMLRSDGHGASKTLADVNFQFTPTTAGAAPPKINSITGKLVATTYFGSTTSDSLPNLGSRAQHGPNPTLTYAKTTDLFKTPVEKVTWAERHVSTMRRDSGYSSAYLDEGATESDASEKQERPKQGSPLRYLTSVDIPFSLPPTNTKLFLPTFHNCIISRVYTLQLSVSVGPTNTAFMLNIPLQIGVEQKFQPHIQEELPSFESAMADVDSYLRPRIVMAPSEELVGNSVLPGYEAVRRQLASSS